MAPPPTLQAGRLVDDRYALESALRGPGIGEVWKAADTHHAGRQVRLKFLHAQPGLEEEEFVAFAKSLQPLRHSNVLPVLDQGVWNGLPYEVFNLGAESTLEDWLDEVRANGRELSFDQAWRAFDRMAQGVAAAHAANNGKGIVHGCLTPASIVVERRGDTVTDVKVCDLGLAAFDEIGTERVGKLPGFTEYLAPEQADGATETFATDVFALGVILCELLGGRAPSTPPMWQVARNGGAASFVDRIRPEMPPPLRDVIVSALDPFASRRPTSASVLHDALRTVWPGSPPVSSTVIAPALRLERAPASNAANTAASRGPTSAIPALGGPALGPARSSAATPLFDDPTHPGFHAPIDDDPTGDFGPAQPPSSRSDALQRPPARIDAHARDLASAGRGSVDVAAFFPPGMAAARGGDTVVLRAPEPDPTEGDGVPDDRTVAVHAPASDDTVAIEIPPEDPADAAPYAPNYPTNLPTLPPPTRNGPRPQVIAPASTPGAYGPYGQTFAPSPRTQRGFDREPLSPAARWALLVLGAIATIGLGVLLAVWIGSH